MASVMRIFCVPLLMMHALGTSICQFRRSRLSRTPELVICHQAAHYTLADGCYKFLRKIIKYCAAIQYTLNSRCRGK
uniref:Putative ovule protein n=1 Tax=Solanum chacoense TaxID=4108 RepID=A0A0V0HGD9_SOLCH